MSAPGIALELEEFLLRIVPGLTEHWRGAPPEAIEQIERIAGRPLPPVYRWFLTRMGQSMGPLTYPTLDFSAERVLTCYTQKWVAPDPRFLLIGHESDEMMPLHVFYDFDAPAREDALVTKRHARGVELHDTFETLHEMLAWGAFLIFRIDGMAQQCRGVIQGDDSGLLARLEPVMSSLGLTRPLTTGPLCGLYERHDVAMVCKALPRDDVDDTLSFTLGGTHAGALRRVLGAIATMSSLEVEVMNWSPGLR